MDIESLLAGHIETMLQDEGSLKKFIYNHSGLIGFAFGFLFFLASVVGAYITLKSFWRAKVAAVQTFLTSETTSQNLVKKIDYLIQYMVSGEYSYFDNRFLLCLIISGAVAFALGAWVTASAENRPRSFVLLSKKAEEFRNKYLQRRKKSWVLFGLSIIGSVGIGVIANIIYAFWFRP